jgi:hypothetical protein
LGLFYLKREGRWYAFVFFAKGDGVFALRKKRVDEILKERKK